MSLLVESIVAGLYTPGEERSQVVDTKGPGGQDIIVLELGDDVIEGVLEGWFVHHAVALV